MDFLTMGFSVDTLQLFAGAFVLAVGAHCLPIDMRRPGYGGITGVPLDIALIVVGVAVLAPS